MEPKITEKLWKKEFEEPIVRKWKEKNVYKFNPETKKPVFSIDTPPPYVNAPVHIGQATVYTIMDMIARFKRMTGFEVFFPMGLDRNGLPIEIAAEKRFDISITSTPREKFIEYCKKLLEESSAESLDAFYKLGHSYISWAIGPGIGEIYLTDSDSYRALTQSTFIDLWNQGMIYESNRINNYCPGCKTTIADSEIEYEDLQTNFNDVKFAVKETGEEIIIATTRPELLCSCVMVIYNPDDDRYKHLEGKHAIVPVYNLEVPIKAHPYAKMETGTGLAMMCSFGDYTDIRFFREEGIKPIIAINSDGTMNEKSGILSGMKISDARKKIIQILKDSGKLLKQQQFVHRTPICERCKSPIEFIAMTEYYLKQLDIKNEVEKISERVKFFAPESRRLLLDWINSLSMDWAISRRRYYSTEIPLWYCKKCGEVIVPEKGKYYRPWKEKSPVKKCPKCGSAEFTGDERVFDTWFDSSITPLYILNYARNDKFFKKSFPCSLRPQGKEIVRTWLYYTLLRSYQLTKKPVFENIWIHYHVLDEKGNKMSKSAGNVIDPHEVIEKFGAEPFRLWSVLEGDITRGDLRCSFERIEGGSKFLTKLWNVARFVSMFPNAEKPKHLCELDKWILGELDELVKETREFYENYDFHQPVADLKHFIWETFASHYIELVKNRAYNQNGVFTKEEEESARHTLHHVLDTILLLLAPVSPILTYKIYNDLRGGDIHSLEFPKSGKYTKTLSTTEIAEINSFIWKAKKDKGLSLKAEIQQAVLPEKLKPIEKDMKETHKIKSIKYGERLELVL
jgi:valyl-tRNA synthetase